MSGFIEIKHERTCQCKPSNLSCISAKDWMKDQIGVWSFNYESRDVRDKAVHPAAFPISLAAKIIELFTHEGELVLDPFVGSGTTLVAAQDLNRNAIGVDLQPDYVTLANSRVANLTQGLQSKQIAICDDARNIPLVINPGTVKLILTSPPYANILNRERKNKSRRGDLRDNMQFGKVEQYSQDDRDLGVLSSEPFETAICSIFEGLKPVLCPKAHVIINMTDAWIGSERVPLHINIIQAMRKAGYVFRNTIIWDRRNLVNQIGIFGWPSSYITMGTTFEYILDFCLPTEKPKEKRHASEE